MDFEQEFLDWILDNHPETNVACYDIVPSNAQPYRGIMQVRKEGVSPIFHLSDYENAYRATGSFEYVYSGMMRDMAGARSYANDINFANHDFTSRDYILENVRLKMVRPDLKDGIIKKYPYMEWADLVAIPVVSRDNDNDEVMTALISNDMLQKLGLSPQEVFDAAMNNITPHANTMRSLFSDMVGIDELFTTINTIPFYVITSGNRELYGAAAVLNESFLETVANTIGGDVALIPSSIHEFIAVPAGLMSPDEMKGIIMDVNDEVVEAKDVLSSTPYIYNRLTKTVSVFTPDNPENRRSAHV